MLMLESLPDETRLAFQFLASEESLRPFTLIGGTALSLQINHRRSEDLDFWLPAMKLDKTTIDKVLRAARLAGFKVELLTPAAQIVASKINGVDILSFAQDYAVGGVKVTFFARNDAAYAHFDRKERLPNTGTSFAIMGEDGIFEMKSYVIHHRTRSRDLYDLKTFVERGRTIKEILQAGTESDPCTSAEYAKAVLVGDVPLDGVDEGFESVSVSESIEDIYDFFSQKVNAYEQALATGIMRAKQRVESLSLLGKEGGAAYTFWTLASAAIQEAGTPEQVSWDSVHSATVEKCIGEYGQDPQEVARVLCMLSPGCVTDEAQEKLRHEVTQKAPDLQRQLSLGKTHSQTDNLQP